MAVEHHVVPGLLPDHRHPVIPFVDAEQDREAAPQIRGKIAPRRGGVFLPHHQQLAAVAPCSPSEIAFVGSGLVGAGRAGQHVFIFDDPEHQQRELEREGTAQPLVGLRIESHRPPATK